MDAGPPPCCWSTPPLDLLPRPAPAPEHRRTLQAAPRLLFSFSSCALSSLHLLPPSVFSLPRFSNSLSLLLWTGNRRRPPPPWDPAVRHLQLPDPVHPRRIRLPRLHPSPCGLVFPAAKFRAAPWAPPLLGLVSNRTRILQPRVESSSLTASLPRQMAGRSSASSLAWAAASSSPRSGRPPPATALPGRIPPPRRPRALKSPRLTSASPPLLAR